LSISADEIKEILKERHQLPRWICVTELPTTTGYPPAARFRPLEALRVIDVFAMALWPSLHYERIAYEIKINRNDWLKELADPKKRVKAMSLSHRFYFVLAPNIYKEDSIDDNCGILEVRKEHIKVIHRAARRKIGEMSQDFVASLARRIKQESSI